VASIKYKSDLDADGEKSEGSSCISTNFECPTFAYINILNMRTKISSHRNEKNINRKFVWLKVASVNMSYIMVDCVPLPIAPLLFVKFL